MDLWNKKQKSIYSEGRQNQSTYFRNLEKHDFAQAKLTIGYFNVS